ncbi:hypothetical protein HFN90_11830 [Rhizobium laguerreae]|nr:hypothetical protein [Rhizobium laguerreae]MBY3400500.1 hypothetical protein [Rhizobium laguerreae]MBY3407438.1 hypothetical protein [Rhizobium laguerreae]
MPDFSRALSRVWSTARAQLIPDAGFTWKRAWSLRLIELAAVSDIILNVVPVVSDYLPWWLTLALLGGAYVARLLIQNKEAPVADQ